MAVTGAVTSYIARVWGWSGEADFVNAAPPSLAGEDVDPMMAETADHARAGAHLGVTMEGHGDLVIGVVGAEGYFVLHDPEGYGVAGFRLQIAAQVKASEFTILLISSPGAYPSAATLPMHVTAGGGDGRFPDVSGSWKFGLCRYGSCKCYETWVMNLTQSNTAISGFATDGYYNCYSSAPVDHSRPPLTILGGAVTEDGLVSIEAVESFPTRVQTWHLQGVVGATSISGRVSYNPEYSLNSDVFSLRR